MDTAMMVIAREDLRRSAPPTDEQLLASYGQGERAALDELFRRHRPAAYRVAYRRLGQEADALDAVQEGFIKAFRNLDALRRGRSFKSWLLRIIMNVAIDLRRQRERRRVGDLRARPAGEETAKAARGLEDAELRGQLNEALASLSEAHRKTFVLHADAELAYREVAEVMGVPVGTVMSRLFHARRKLQTLLAAKLSQA
jgi:RNA polymerase sigma-70 factor (ECF subfamily)